MPPKSCFLSQRGGIRRANELTRMSQRISRRQFAARTVLGTAGAVLAGNALSGPNAPAPQDKKPEEGPHPDLAQLNKRIAKPVPEELAKGVTAGLKHNDDLSVARMKHKLKEGSEPTSIYKAVKK